MSLTSEAAYGASNTDENYFDLSLKELSEIPLISGISRKKQDSFHAASASYVITQQAIRNSGMTSIPDLLRMVPGFHVTQSTGNIWSINARSPNSRFSDELLVMIDGRSVYNTLINGTYWSRVDTMLEDIERIEVIRGPGSSLWGSNASNGIVNIVTKSASKTQGGLLNISGGNEQFDNEFSARYGFSGDKHDSRIYIKQTRLVSGTFPTLDEQSRPLFTPYDHNYDGRKFVQGGFRSDIFISEKTNVTLQGDYYDTDEQEIRIPDSQLLLPFKNKIDATGHNFLVHLNHELNDDSAIALQFFVDYTEFDDNFFHDIRETYDLDLQHNFSWSGHEVIWGAGYREVHNRTEHFGNIGGFALDPANRNDYTSTFFIQDKVNLIDESLFVILGSKFEQNSYTDYESQPSIKLGYNYNENTFFWASFAKAVSTPSRTVSDAYLDFSAFDSFCSALGDGFSLDSELGCIRRINASELDSNVLYAKELGYRQKFSNGLSIDNTIFYHDYRQQPTSTHLTDYVWGYEGAFQYAVNDDWQLNASLTYHRGRIDDTLSLESSVPRITAYLGSWHQVNDKFSIDVNYYYTGHTDGRKLSSFDNGHDSFDRLDLRLAYQASKQLDLSLTITNLFDPRHTEGNYDSKRANSNIERAFIGKISYKFN
jgi:iron complex outermembrane receptor protein